MLAFRHVLALLVFVVAPGAASAASIQATYNGIVNTSANPSIPVGAINIDLFVDDAALGVSGGLNIVTFTSPGVLGVGTELGTIDEITYTGATDVLEIRGSILGGLFAINLDQPGCSGFLTLGNALNNCTGYNGGTSGGILSLSGSAFFDIAAGAPTITIVPEPGTSILMGLGLFTLANAKRKSSRLLD